MSVTATMHHKGVRIVTMNYPPVNALPVAGWFAVADAMRDAAADPETRIVVLRAEGRGFNAGVDIKEMQQIEGAGNGGGLGGGLGLAGNCDVIIASDDAYFGVPEVDRGALGAATHLGRLVPQHMLRAMYYTSRTISAQRLAEFGSVLEVVPRDQLDAAALSFAEEIAEKDPRVIKAAKEALNFIDPVDVNLSYRIEQGFTFELNLAGVADEHRDEFVATGTTLST